MPLPRPGWRIPHRRTHISRSPLLLREVRRGFSEERQFHFQLAVAALELPHPLVIRHSFRERLPGTLLPVCFHPKAEGGVIYFEFPRYLGDRQGVIDYLPGSLLLELRSVSFRFSRHSFPSFPGENPTGSPVRKRWGTSRAPNRPLPQCTTTSTARARSHRQRRALSDNHAPWKAKFSMTSPDSNSSTIRADELARQYLDDRGWDQAPVSSPSLRGDLALIEGVVQAVRDMDHHRLPAGMPHANEISAALTLLRWALGRLSDYETLLVAAVERHGPGAT